MDDDRGQDVHRDEGPSGRFQGAGGLRIGTAERQRAVELLRQHTSAGRLELDEFEERVVSAHQARTGPELDALFRDLPPLDSSGAVYPSGWSPNGGWNGSDRNGGTRSWTPATASRPPRHWAIGGLVPLWVVVAVFVVAAASSGAYFFWPFLWVIGFVFFFRHWSRRGYYRGGWGGYGRSGWYGPGGYRGEGWNPQQRSGSSDRHDGPSTWV